MARRMRRAFWAGERHVKDSEGPVWLEHLERQAEQGDIGTRRWPGLHGTWLRVCTVHCLKRSHCTACQSIIQKNSRGCCANSEHKVMSRGRKRAEVVVRSLSKTW